MRILFFGLLGMLSRLPLASLLAADVELCGLVLPAEIVPPFQLIENGRPSSSIVSIRQQSSIPNLLSIEQIGSPLALAAANGIPAFATRDLAAPETVATLAALKPDVICVSCFPHRLPPAILNLPTLGCLNVHPSLLPKFRGPAPLFWTLRAGEPQAGVTIHFMDEQFDTGNVARQRPYPLQDGLSYAEIESSLADLGGTLLVEALRALAEGTLQDQPQPSGYSSDPWPQDDDFELELRWSAQRAFNFMCGTENWERPYFVQVGNEKIWLKTAVAWDPAKRLPQEVVRVGQSVQIQFSPGVLTAMTAH